MKVAVSDMRLMVRDRNGNSIGFNGFNAAPVSLNETEASRVEGFSIELSDNGETLIVTLDLEES